jgi:hypothetical protein
MNQERRQGLHAMAHGTGSRTEMNPEITRENMSRGEMSSRLQKKAVSHEYIKTEQEKEIGSQPWQILLASHVGGTGREERAPEKAQVGNASKIAENENANFGEAPADLECQKAPASAMECARDGHRSSLYRSCSLHAVSSIEAF